MVGEYVRLIIAPKTHRGTVIDRRKELGHVEYLFHHDERFENRVRDFWVLETEIEMWPRPTDAEAKVITANACAPLRVVQVVGERQIRHALAESTPTTARPVR